MVVFATEISAEEKEGMVRQQAEGNSLYRYHQREVYGGDTHALRL